MKMRLLHRGLILVGVPFLVELILAGSLAALLYQSIQERAAEALYRSYSAEMSRLIGYVSSAPLVLAGAVHFRNEKLFREYETQVYEVKYAMNNLHSIMGQIKELPPMLYETLSHQVISVLQMSETLASHRAEIASGNLPLSSIMQFQNDMSAAKQVVAVRLNDMYASSDKMLIDAQNKVAKTRQNQYLILYMVPLLNVVMAVALGWFYKVGILDRIKTIAKNTDALAKGTALAPPLRGGDEIAKFDQAFHSMLDQLKRAGQIEQELFENASDVICVIDADNNVVRVNPACVKDWGVKPEEICGENLQLIISESDYQMALNAISEAKEKNASVEFEARTAGKNNNQRIGQWSVYWSPDEAQLFCIIHDITEQKLVEAAKKQFLTMISSDLRLPLSKIEALLGRLPELAATELNALGQEKIKMAQKNVMRLLSLVNDLLQVAQMESGELELEPQNTSLNGLLRRAASDVESLARAKNLRLEVKACDGSVFVDSDRIMQVLINLLSNAIKFSPEGSALEIYAEPRGRFIELRVNDRGRGVPESHRQKIFEKFSQVEVSDGKRKSGTGLGLPICKQIVEQHGGKIGVEGREGGGTSFYFTIPADKETFEALQTAATRSGEIAAATNSLQTAKSLPAKPPRSQSRFQRGAEMRTALASREKAPFGTTLPLVSKGLLLVAIPAIFELAFVAVLSNSLNEMEQARQQELHFRKMASEASKVTKAVFYATSVGADATSSIAWQHVQTCYREWAESQDELEKLVDDDPRAKVEFQKLKVQSRKINAFRKNLLERRRTNGDEGVTAGMAARLNYLPPIIALTVHLRRILNYAETKEAIGPEIEVKRLQAQFIFIAIGLLVNVITSLGIATFFSLSISRRIFIMVDNTERLSSDEPLNGIMGGADEIADLDRSFHRVANALSDARKKERAIFDNSQDVLCIVSPTGKFVSVNAAVEPRWGYGKKELIEKGLEEVIPGDDLEKTRAALLGDAAQTNFESKLKTGNGEIREVLWSASHNADERNAYCVVRDISNRKALERLRQEFLGMVSHDLRTPLTAVSGVTQLMQSGMFGAVNEPTAKCLQEIRKHVNALLELISDILDLEKLDAGKMDLNISKVSMDVLLQAIQSTCNNEDVVLKSTVASAFAGIVLEADKERLSQSIINLVKYLYYLGEKEVTLMVRQNAGRVEMRISDCGPALSEKQRQRLFVRIKEPLEEQKRIGAEHYFHADLALPLAAKTIESHAGRLIVEEQNGQNVFLLAIPLSNEKPAS
jgi:PAS domain S-box-containing protein